MNRRALMWTRVAWIAVTLALMAAWREEALVLLLPLVLLGPVVRELAPTADRDERERFEDYRASHVALMCAFALMFLVVAKRQVVDGTAVSAEWLLVFLLPLLVRAGLSMGRGVGARRLGLTVGFAAGAAWLGFSLVSHGLSWATLAEAWIGGGILLFTAIAGRWQRAGGALLAVLSAALFALVARQAVGHGRWGYGLAMTAMLVLPPLLAGLALLASAPSPGAAGPDEFADLRGRPGATPVGRRAPGSPRRPDRLGWLAAIAVFAACTTVLAVLASAPPPTPATASAPRKELLNTPREIDGVPCAVRAFYDASRRLQTCTLSRDHEFPNGLTLPAGTQVTVDGEGRPSTAFLPAITTLDGHRCIGDGTHNPMTNFHPNGRLRFCNLAEAETIQGIPCQRSSFWGWILHGGAGTYFHDNGVLQKCLLAADVTYDGRALRQGEHVSLDAGGHVVEAPRR